MSEPQLALYRAHPDAHCQRGLHIVYELLAPLDAEEAIARLQRVYTEKLVVGAHQLGARRVRVALYQFRFEVRFGQRNGEVSYLHRMLASPEQRSSDRCAFESVIAELLGKHQGINAAE